MGRAEQVEKVADGLCRALGGLHGAKAASNVICPLGVRLLREVAASRLEGRPASGARVLDSARLTLRSLVRLPAKGVSRAVLSDTAKVLVRRQLGGGQVPFTGKQSSMAKLEDQLRGVQRHAMKGGAFRGAAQALESGAFRRKLRGAGSLFFPPPGESGF